MSTYFKLLLYTLLLGILFGFINLLLIVPVITLSNMGAYSNILLLYILRIFNILFFIFPLFAAYFTGRYIKEPSVFFTYSFSKIVSFYFSFPFITSIFNIELDLASYLAIGLPFYYLFPFTDSILFFMGAWVGKKKNSQNLQR